MDRERTPDRVYILWKHTDAATANQYVDENIQYGMYDYDGLVGGASSWGAVAEAFPTGHAGALPHGTTAVGPLRLLVCSKTEPCMKLRTTGPIQTV